MRFVVLGGAGDMGSAIVRDLVNSDVSEVIIADFNQEKANSICSELNGKKTKLSAQFVDANDHASLVQAIKGADVVANAIGPFYKYGLKTVKAAIEASVPYVDINDDYDATKAALELDDEAKKAGIAPAFSEGKIYDFPQPVGKVQCFYCGHPEPVTIPRFIRGIKAVTLRGGFYPEIASGYLTAITQLGLTSTEPIKVGEASISPRDFITAYASSFNEDDLSMGMEPCSGTWVEVRGGKGGKPTRYAYRAADRMYKQTGFPPSIGAQMLANSQIKATGVLAPEACIDPVPFFAELAKRNIAIYETEETTAKL